MTKWFMSSDWDALKRVLASLKKSPAGPDAAFVARVMDDVKRRPPHGSWAGAWRAWVTPRRRWAPIGVTALLVVGLWWAREQASPPVTLSEFADTMAMEEGSEPWGWMGEEL